MMSRSRKQSNSVHSVNKNLTSEFHDQGLECFKNARRECLRIYVCNTDWVLFRVWERERAGAAIQCRDLRNQSCVRICVLPGCSIRMCTLLFGYKSFSLFRFFFHGLCSKFCNSFSRIVCINENFLVLMQLYATQHHEDQIYSSFAEGPEYWI
jgi:hypothetical protein